MMSDEVFIRNTLSRAEVMGRMGRVAWQLAIAAYRYEYVLKGELAPYTAELTEEEAQDAFEAAYVEVVNCAGVWATNEYWERREHELLPTMREKWRKEVEKEYGGEYHEVDQNE